MANYTFKPSKSYNAKQRNITVSKNGIQTSIVLCHTCGTATYAKPVTRPGSFAYDKAFCKDCYYNKSAYAVHILKSFMEVVRQLGHVPGFNNNNWDSDVPSGSLPCRPTFFKHMDRFFGEKLSTDQIYDKCLKLKI